MSAYAIIENGLVVNVAMADPEYAAEQGWLEMQSGAGIGWAWDGSTFTPPPPPPPAVPEQVAMLNAHLVLIDAGHMPAIDAYLDSLTGIAGAKGRAYFRLAQTVRRDHELVEVLRQVLNLTHAQIDGLFIVAASLP